MDLKYKIGKKWNSYIQKYKLKTQYQNVRKLLLFLFVVWILGSLLTIISEWLFARDVHQTMYEYIQYFWIVIIELVSGFDIPDYIPLHPVSRIISIIMLFMGIIVVGLFTGQIISIFVLVHQKTEYFPEKPENFKFDTPILICGKNIKLYNIIKNLRKSIYARNREIVIVDQDAQQIKKPNEEKFQDVWYFRGNPADRKVLEKVIGRNDCRVIILSEDTNNFHKSNASTVKTALAIEAFNENVHTVLEIAHNQDVAYYKETRINDWINISEYSLKLISQSALQPGMAKVFTLLLGEPKQHNLSAQIHFSALPLTGRFVGKSYEHVKKRIYTEFSFLNITLIGFTKYLDDEQKKKFNLTLRNTNHFVQINPIRKPADVADGLEFFYKNGKLSFYSSTKLNPNDQLIYLSSQAINFNKIIKISKNRNGDSA